MKKLFLSLVAVMVAATAMYAQSSMLATLSHNGEISTYYGASALKDAVTAADNGDVITLSSGSFTAVDITKGITIRGAGMDLSEKNQTEPTVIIGNFIIDIAEDITSRLTIEGIYHNHMIQYKRLVNATFIKDRLNKISYYGSNAVLKNASFIHCKIASYLYLVSNCSASCVNCVIWEPYSGSTETANFEFVNCVIHCNNIGNVYSSSFKNCILIGNNSASNCFSSFCTVYHCVDLEDSDYAGVFKNIPNTTNSTATYKAVMKTYTYGGYNDSETFELTDEAKAKYLGLDGTQVGIYGGNMPFDPTPSNPQITKCNVAAKSTADGKLSVDITVNGAE